MLNHPTLDQLKTLKLTGMYKAFCEQSRSNELHALSFEERLGLLIDREITERANRALNARLRNAKLKQQASIEDIDTRHPRALDKGLLASLLNPQWIGAHRNILITGPTGVGKTFIGCALAHMACREGFSALYVRLPRLLPELAIGKGDGRYARLFRALAKVNVLLLDDWALAKLSPEARHDLLELIDERHERGATIVTSQLPVTHWHEWVNDPTLADAMLDRLVHNSYQIALKGESLRKKKETLTSHDETK